MPRIRSIKPEFWSDEKLALMCSRDARLLFVAIWNFADDKGRAKAHPAVLKAQAFPYDDVSRDQVAGWIAELEAGRFIRRYEAEGEVYISVRTWVDHQKIDRPQKSGYCPEPPKDLWRDEKASSTPRRSIAARSSNDRRTIVESTAMESDQDLGVETDQDQQHLPSRENARSAADGSGSPFAPLPTEAPPAASAATQGQPTPPPAASPARPELKLEQPPAKPAKGKRRGKKREVAPEERSEWAYLADDLAGLRITVPMGDVPVDESFGAEAGQSVAAVEQAVAYIAEEFKQESESAKAKLLQACWLYCRDEWPGRMDRMVPWSLWVLMKRQHLGRYVLETDRHQWKLDQSTGLWEAIA